MVLLETLNFNRFSLYLLFGIVNMHLVMFKPISFLIFLLRVYFSNLDDFLYLIFDRIAHFPIIVKPFPPVKKKRDCFLHSLVSATPSTRHQAHPLLRRYVHDLHVDFLSSLSLSR